MQLSMWTVIDPRRQRKLDPALNRKGLTRSNGHTDQLSLLSLVALESLKTAQEVHTDFALRANPNY